MSLCGACAGRFFPFFFPSRFLSSKSASAQDQPPAQNPPSKPLSQKDRKQQARKFAKESAPYNTWLTEEVIYIITKEERDAFLRLTTNEEREQFIEEFWRRRNPDPDSPENTYREEHYRRIAYANERFSSGIPGWKTDRGHIFILWGPPDEIDSHPTGGTYDRPPEQGGGSTTTYPWELWRYRHLEDIGDNIELEFVDPSGSGEYHLTMDPGEKDALAKVPGAGLSTCEQLGLCSKAQRFTNTNGTTLPAPLGGLSAGLDEFDIIDRYFKAQRPPEHFKDLAAMVTVTILRNQIHMDYRFDFLRVTHDSVLVPITLQVANRDLSFKGKDGVQSAVLNLYGRITTLSGRVVQTFRRRRLPRFPRFSFSVFDELVFHLPEVRPFALRLVSSRCRPQRRAKRQRRRDRRRPARPALRRRIARRQFAHPRRPNSARSHFSSWPRPICSGLLQSPALASTPNSPPRTKWASSSSSIT